MTASPINPDENRRPATNPGDEMLTLQEACAFLRVPEGTLRYWRHLGCRTPQLQDRPPRPLLAHRPHPLAHRTDQPSTEPPLTLRRRRTPERRWNDPGRSITMAGSIAKRTQRQVAGPVPRRGRPEALAHFDRKIDAQQWLDQVDRRRSSPARTPTHRPGRITFAAFFGEWSARQVWAPGTVLAMSLAAEVRAVRGRSR